MSMGMGMGMGMSMSMSMRMSMSMSIGSYHPQSRMRIFLFTSKGCTVEMGSPSATPTRRRRKERGIVLDMAVCWQDLFQSLLQCIALFKCSALTLQCGSGEALVEGRCQPS